MPAGRETPDVASVLQLRAAGACLVLDCRGGGLPLVVHWGADLGDLDRRALIAVADSAVPAVPSSSPDDPRRVALLPEHATGYAGRAGMSGGRPDGDSVPPRFLLDGVQVDPDPAGGPAGQRLAVHASDAEIGLELTTELRLSPRGVLTMRHVLGNTGTQPYELRELPAVLPVPGRATELLDFTGRHLRERSPQRLPFGFGAWVREQRRGRTGHDSPVLLVAGTGGFGFRHGEVWGVHVAWSGHASTFAERLPESWSAIGGGELLHPGELLLESGERYVAPWLHAAYSGRGLDGITAALVADLRARPEHPRTPRPVLLNTWEAVYFDHDLDRLVELADVAAEVGVERFVLDDGWFGSRRGDASGLGDWVVSPDVWPGGLSPLVDHVTKLGLQFGLWVEPEMVNPDSDLARAHPDWILAAPGRTPPLARRQQVLDLANPLVTAYLLERLDALLSEYEVGYLKWDHNRDLIDAAGLVGGRHRAGVHAQTLALYALIDELRRRHPGVEIESCAGGGGRLDLGILARTDRIWASDCNDPLERQQIQRWTGLLLPPELIGAHVGPPEAHSTGRTAGLAFRAGTALFGHFGIEWDLTSATVAERAELASWIDLYRRFRGLLHAGTVVRADAADASGFVHGVVAESGDEAVFAAVQLATTPWTAPPPILLPGLDAAREYRIRPLPPGDRPTTIGTPPAWLTPEGVVLPGGGLEHLGLPAPVLAPEQLILLHVTAA